MLPSGPERRRRRAADGPGWLYAPTGQLRAWWRLLLFGGMLLVAGQIVPTILVPVFSLLSRALGEPVAVYPWVTLGAVMMSLVVALRMVDEEPWSSIALGHETWRPRTLLLGWTLGCAVIAATAVLLMLPGYLSFERVSFADSGSMLQSAAGESWGGTALRLFALLAPAALWEELVFRGYLWKVAEDAGGTTIALWATSVTFGLVHLLNPNPSVLATLLVILAGVCLGLVRMRIGLPAAWLAHLAWNWVMSAVLHVPVSGIPSPDTGYRAVIVGPSWLTGGEWGPEGGAAAAVVLGSALFMAQRGSRTGGKFNQWWKRNSGDGDAQASSPSHSERS